MRIRDLKTKFRSAMLYYDMPCNWCVFHNVSLNSITYCMHVPLTFFGKVEYYNPKINTNNAIFISHSNMSHGYFSGTCGYYCIYTLILIALFFSNSEGALKWCVVFTVNIIFDLCRSWFVCTRSKIICFKH